MWPTAYIWTWNVADHLKMRTTSIFPCRHFNLPLPSIPLSLRNNCLKLKIPRKLPITNESVEVWDFRKITHHTWTSWGSKCQGTYPSQMNRLSLRNNRVEVQDFMKISIIDARWVAWLHASTYASRMDTTFRFHMRMQMQEIIGLDPFYS